MIDNEKSAAIKSSSIIPMPFFTWLSIAEIGQGLRISNALNKIKPTSIHTQSFGTINMVTKYPTISS